MNAEVVCSVRAMPSRTRSGVLLSVTSLPPSSTRPESSRDAPEISLSAVVLPEPFGPISAVGLAAGQLESQPVDRHDAAERLPQAGGSQGPARAEAVAAGAAGTRR